jgi:hypothetical protein
MGICIGITAKHTETKMATASLDLYLFKYFKPNQKGDTTLHSSLPSKFVHELGYSLVELHQALSN